MKILCQLVNCSKRIILISLAIGVVAAIIIFFVIVKDGNWRQNEMEEMRDSFDTGIVFAEQSEEQADTEEEQDPMVEIWYEPEDGNQDLSFRELPDAQRETGIASVSGGSAYPELNPEEDLNNNTIPDKWEEQFSLTDHPVHPFDYIVLHNGA